MVGSSLRLTSDPAADESPAWFPDGRALAFTSERGGEEDIDSLWVVDVAGGDPRQVATRGDVQVQPAWSADGRFLYFRSIRDGIAAVWRQPAGGGPPTRVTLGGGAEHSPSLSADGRWLAYSTLAEHEALVAMDTRTGRRGRFEDMRRIGTIAAAPDGKSAVFVSDRDDRPNLWQLPLGDEPRRVTDHTGKCAWPSFSPDGRWITYYRTIDLAWSPDGNALAFVAAHDGVDEVWRTTLGGGEPPITITAGAEAAHVRWPREKDYIIEMEKVRAAQSVIEKLFLGGDPEEEIDDAKAAEIQKTYWAALGEEPPEGVVAAKAPRTLNSWNC